MSEKNLPLPFDIHGGGQDLIFPHHENEIAQTEAATGKPLSRFWVHNGFVQIDSEKMSKSLNNFKTIRDILEQYLPEVLRLFLLGRHYRSPVDFTVEAVEEAEKNCKRLYETLAAADAELARPDPKGGSLPEDIAATYADLANAWDAVMDDDMNTAAALGHMNSLAHLMGRIMEDKALRKNAGGRDCLKAAREIFTAWGRVLGLFLLPPPDFLSDLKICRARRKNVDVAQVEKLMAERRAAREAKDFAASDALRDALAALGVIVRDTPEGAVWDMA
jgi:cysteinyl-tRNA synthetase